MQIANKKKNGGVGFFQPGNFHFLKLKQFSSYSLIVRVRVVLKRTVVGD